MGAAARAIADNDPISETPPDDRQLSPSGQSASSDPASRNPA